MANVKSLAFFSFGTLAVVGDDCATFRAGPDTGQQPGKEAGMKPRRLIQGLAPLVLMLSACAGSSGTVRTVGPSAMSQLAAREALTIRVDGTPSVQLTDADKERLTQLIVKHVEADVPGRFKAINQPGAPSPLEALVTITAYDEGNAFARAMLAGLGQMHIDANVILTDPQSGKTFATYEVDKTFAWGGIYGASTRITDIEDGFAQSVAAAIGGNEE